VYRLLKGVVGTLQGEQIQSWVVKWHTKSSSIDRGPLGMCKQGPNHAF